jgi:hypothetical protein
MKMSAASFQSSQLSVAPARESDHGNANECSQFSVISVFSRASAGVRSRLAGIGGQKSETEASSLAKVFFFESHIRATNAPVHRIPILTRSLPLSSPFGPTFG